MSLDDLTRVVLRRRRRCAGCDEIGQREYLIDQHYMTGASDSELAPALRYLAELRKAHPAECARFHWPRHATKPKPRKRRGSKTWQTTPAAPRSQPQQRRA